METKQTISKKSRGGSGSSGSASREAKASSTSMSQENIYSGREYWVKPWRHNGIAGTKRSLKSYLLYLDGLITAAMGGGSNLSSEQKEKLASYISFNYKSIIPKVDQLPDDSVPTHRKDGTQIMGPWSVLNAGTETVKKWISDLDSVVKDKTGQTRQDYVSSIASELREFTLILDYYYGLSKEIPAETPTVEKNHEGTITLYRRMWSGEAEKILKNNKLKDGMTGSDSYKKYFTTDQGHTQTFSNASSTNPDDEVVLAFTVDWDEYWAFVAKYGTPNQQTGALDIKESAIMNQERIVKGAGANFRVDDQVKKVVARSEHHNIGIGVGNVLDFDKIVKGRIKLIKL